MAKTKKHPHDKPSKAKSIYTGDQIPSRLCKNTVYPRVAMTVGKLRELLAEYPEEMPIGIGLSDAVLLSWSNIGQLGREHLYLDEYESEDTGEMED